MIRRLTLVAASLWCASLAWSQGLVEFPVSAGPHVEMQPTISFGVVAWTDNRNAHISDFDIWGTYLTLPVFFPICEGPGDQLRPSIDAWGADTLCVWEDYRSLIGAPDVYGRYLVSGLGCFPIASTMWIEDRPRCWGENVLYQRADGTETSPNIWRCYLPELDNQPFVVQPDDQITPDLFGYSAVWSDNRPVPIEVGWDIYSRDLRLTEDHNLTTSVWRDREPDISGAWCVFQTESSFGGDWDIYAVRVDKPFEPPIPICTDPANQTNPAIWGNIVVWEDDRNGPTKIYGYDMTVGREFPVTTPDTPSIELEPDVSQNVVVFTRYTTSNPDVIGVLMNFATITGSVELGHFIGDAQALPLELEIWGVVGEPLRVPIRLDANGRFVATTLLEGWYHIALKGSHWLRDMADEVYHLELGSTVDVPFRLINGDAHEDNQVDLLDVNTVLTRFGNPAPDNADLDGSGKVDLPDLNIALINFGLVGEP